MRIPSTFLSLPPSLLLLLATQLYAQPDSSKSKKNGGGGGDPGLLLPTAVRKMSLDEGEMFMTEYYAFAPDDVLNGGNPQSPPLPPHPMVAREANTLVLTPEEVALLAANSSATLSFRSPFPRHLDYRDSDWRSSSVHDTARGYREKDGGHGGEEGLYRRARNALARLQGRDFACPGGTHVCSNIDRPNYCCTDGATCFIVENAPNAGNVGCCPEGQTCGGSVASCADGNTACPAEEGGGCCIPGFICADVGCIASSVTVIPPTTTTAIPVTSNAATTTTTTKAPSTTTTTPTTTSKSPSSTPIPTSDSSTGTGLPPVRPTSSNPQTTDTTPNPKPTTTTALTTPGSPYCPTGFYACLASPAPGSGSGSSPGCCRVGRDCSSTSCPPATPLTTIITDHGVTIAVPLTDAQEAAESTPTATNTNTKCADGWFLCGGKSAGEGCCPSGYACGKESCTLVAPTATQTVAKEVPEGNAAVAGMRVRRGSTVFLALSVAFGWTAVFL